MTIGGTRSTARWTSSAMPRLQRAADSTIAHAASGLHALALARAGFSDLSERSAPAEYDVRLALEHLASVSRRVAEQIRTAPRFTARGDLALAAFTSAPAGERECRNQQESRRKARPAHDQSILTGRVVG